jgi:hypothetical protein
MMRHCLAAFALAAIGGATAIPAGAAAQPYYPGGREYVARPPYTTYGYSSEVGSGVCQRWCPYDSSPCDPPSFKIADGRCRTSSRSR